MGSPQLYSVTRHRYKMPAAKVTPKKAAKADLAVKKTVKTKKVSKKAEKKATAKKSQEGCAKEKGISRLISFCKTVSKLLPREERRNETQKVDRASSGLIKYK